MTEAEEKALAVLAEAYAEPDPFGRDPRRMYKLLDEPAKALVLERTHPEALENVRQAFFRELTAAADRRALVRKLKIPAILLEGPDGLEDKWAEEWAKQQGLAR